MGEEEMESPIELLRQLIEESGKWTEEIVKLCRNQILVYSYATLQTVIVIWLVLVYNFSSEDPVSIPILAVIGACVVFLFIINGNAIFVLWRKYRNRKARRDLWREKFEILKKREEEIERLLSGEAD